MSPALWFLQTQKPKAHIINLSELLLLLLKLITVLQTTLCCKQATTVLLVAKNNTAKGSPSVTNSKHKVSNIPELVWICGSGKQAKGLGFNNNNNNNNNCASGNKKPNCQKFFCNNNSKPKGLNNPELFESVHQASKQASKQSPKP